MKKEFSHAVSFSKSVIPFIEIYYKISISNLKGDCNIRTDCMFVRLNPLFHYNESEPLDPFVYRCYPSRFFIDSSKAAVFAGVYTSRTDEELFEQAGVEPFYEPSSGEEEWNKYKRNIALMMNNLIENKKLTFLKAFEYMIHEPAFGEREGFLNYFALHDKNVEKSIEERTVVIKAKKKEEKQKLMKQAKEANGY